MKENFSKISTIALAKETESPENPGALEKRVALIPEHIRLLVEKGLSVFVEMGAGEGIGYSRRLFVLSCVYYIIDFVYEYRK